MNWANRWFAIISGGIRDYNPNAWEITWDQDDPKWQYLFRPFFLAIDIESGRNFWEPIAAHTVPNWWSQIPEHDINHIPYAIANPLVLDIFDENGYPISMPGVKPDGHADLMYAGDLNGNLYTIKLYRDNAGFDNNLLCISVHRTKPISQAHYDDNIYRGENQPITVTPVAAFDANKHLRIYFGTGKFDDVEAAGKDDKSDKEPMSFYCLVEDLNTECNGNSVSVTLLGKNITIPSDYCTSDLNTHRWVTAEGQPDGNDCFQCVFDFDQPGERVVDSALVAGGLVFVTTFIPNDDPCVSGGGDSYLYVFDYMCRPLSYDPLQYSGLEHEWLGLGGGWTPGNLPPGTQASAVRASLGEGMPSHPVLDSSGKYVLVQTSDAQIHRIRVELPVRPLYLKGWKEKGE